MGENPKFRKTIERPGLEGNELVIGGINKEITYTGNWEKVDGARGVFCRTWEVTGRRDVDGADIYIEKDGYTPIQLINAAEVVFDIPEEGELICVVMDTDGKVYINSFEENQEDEMRFTQGMIITWIARTEARLTEYESPPFNEQMFVTVPENAESFQGRDIGPYLKIVNDLRLKVEKN